MQPSTDHSSTGGLHADSENVPAPRRGHRRRRAALSPVAGALAKPRQGFGYGPLVEDPGGLLALPRGFHYRLLQNGLTPTGKNYVFASNRLNDSEFAGPTFSPDGHTFFVNIQSPGHTFAIWGPWPRRNAGGQRAMASAAPQHRWTPKVSGEMLEYAAKNGMSPYEAAAYERLGASLA